jgi:hypothetical protein
MLLVASGVILNLYSFEEVYKPSQQTLADIHTLVQRYEWYARKFEQQSRCFLADSVNPGRIILRKRHWNTNTDRCAKVLAQAKWRTDYGIESMRERLHIKLFKISLPWWEVTFSKNKGQRSLSQAFMLREQERDANILRDILDGGLLNTQYQWHVTGQRKFSLLFFFL